MKKEAKEKWVAALRSGNYAQGSGALCSIGSNGAEYCCLGVLVEECEGEECWQISDGSSDVFAFIDGDKHFGSPAQPYQGLSSKLQGDLISLNDLDKLPFSQIADWIEENISED